MLKINEIAPNFNALTTNGKIDFHGMCESASAVSRSAELCRCVV